MRKLFAITFSFLILFQSINLSFEDISRFGILLEHAQYHQETYNDSFFEFITEHYGDTAYHPVSEHDEHNELPFKDHKTCVHANAVFTLSTLYYQFSCESFVEIPFNFYYSESTSLFEKPSIFQPPKFT